MVKTLQYAADKWERKTANAGDRWKTNTLAGDYCKGFGAFLGHPVSEVCANWRSGIEAVQPSQFNAAISGKKSKYIEALSRIR